MYTDFYHLNSYPFENTPDPRFLFPSKKHREVLASLIYGVENSKGFIVLVGDIGTGKTTLIHAFIKEMNPSYLIFNSINPELRVTEIIEYMTKKLKVSSENRGPFEVLEAFKEKLKALSDKELKVVLIIDEAHLLTESSLQKIRLLSNLESAKTKLIQIILVGQNELYQKLRKKSLKTLSQRVVINRYLEPLSKKEIKKYIEHRLLVAGRRSQIFTNKAISVISKGSKGFPRLINHICDNSLLIGYALSVQSIDHRIIKEVVNDMNFKKRKRGLNKFKKKALLWVGAVFVFIILAFWFSDFLFSNFIYNTKEEMTISSGNENDSKENSSEMKQITDALPIKKKIDSRIFKVDENEISNMLGSNLTSTGWIENQKNAELNSKKNIILNEKNQSSQFKKLNSGYLEESVEKKFSVMSIRTDLFKEEYRKDIHIGPLSDSSIPESYSEDDSYEETDDKIFLKSDENNTTGDLNKEKYLKPKSRKNKNGEDKLFNIKIVKPGESLSEISYGFYGASMGVVVDLVQKANPELLDINKIFPGQKIILPHFEKKHLVVKEANGRYMIHYASFYSLEEARESFNRFKKKYDSFSVISNKELQGDTFVYRIYFGFFDSSDDAEKKLVALNPNHLSFILKKTGAFVWNRAE